MEIKFKVLHTILFVAYTNVLGAKITMLQLNGGSQFMTAKVIGEELAKRGHEVTICLPVKKSDRGTHTTVEGEYIKVLRFYQGFDQETYNTAITTAAAGSKTFFSQLELLKTVLKLHDSLCTQIVTDSQVVKSIKDADLLLSQLNLFCGGAIAKLFEKKWIGNAPAVFTEGLSYGHRVYLNPSYYPPVYSTLTDDMNFIQRVQSYIIHEVLYFTVTRWVPKSYATFMAKTGTDASDVVDNFHTAEMIIGNCDFTINYPYPQMPNNVCIGPFTAKPANKLPSKLELMVNSSSHGVIIVTFGTQFGFLHKWQVEAMAGAFGKLKQTVLWQLKDAYEIILPPNINIVQWLPQNDLLGHRKTRLFISHSGLNGILEAGYHGVPVLAVPRAADQLQNSILVSDRVKMGDRLDITRATEDDWLRKIEGILSNESYTINAKRVSRRIRSKNKSPMELAGDLIEYVINNDYDMSHLKSRGPELPWHVVNLYDVYAFLLLVFGIMLLVVYFLIRKCFHILFGRKEKRE